MIKNRDIIIVGQQAWDVEIGSNCKNIALEFSKHNRVLYVNPPLDRITKIRYRRVPKVVKRIKIIDGKLKGLVKIKNNLWTYYPDILIESINWIRIHSVFYYLNKRNNQLFATSTQKAIAELQFLDYILFNDSDMFRSFHLKELLSPQMNIYYSRDNLLATDYWKRHGRILEPKLIQKSDFCFTNSEYLKKYCKKYNPKSYYVGQGCDLELFKTGDLTQIPTQLKGMKSPIIGYVGVLTSLRLDIDLIIYIAEAIPEWNIVLVGPQDEAFRNSRIHDIKNVIFLDAQKPEDMPKYINAFNVCINPQILNDLTIGNYPRKIDEYLALGKPVVATKTEAMVTFKDYVLLAENKYEFVEMVKEAIEQDDIELIGDRKEFAFSHSWKNSVEMISNYIIS